MEGICYHCKEDFMGNITLYSGKWPNDDDEENSIYLQGDDAELFNKDWEDIVKIWTRKCGNGYRKHYGPFNSYEEHMDVIISQYFN